MPRITSEEPDISLLIHKLSNYCYPELATNRIHVSWASDIGAVAFVKWIKTDLTPIQIFCNTQMIQFKDPVITGVIAHELSHVANKFSDEGHCDYDVINRGLGVYLAVARVVTNMIEDQPAVTPSSPYLGYYTIRKYLSKPKRDEVDMLLNTIVNFKIGVDAPLIFKYYDLIMDLKEFLK